MLCINDPYKDTYTIRPVVPVKEAQCKVKSAIEVKC